MLYLNLDFFYKPSFLHSLEVPQLALIMNEQVRIGSDDEPRQMSLIVFHLVWIGKLGCIR